MNRQKIGILSAAGMILILAGSFGYWLSQPAVGHQEKVSLMPQIKTSTKTKELPPASSVTTSYFSLNLPAGYTPQQSQHPGSGLLYSETIIKPGATGSLIINIGITNLGTGGLENNSSYRLRVQQPQTYQLTTESFNGSTVHVGTRRDGTSGEVVAFWVHGGYLGTISVTSGVGNSGSGDTPSDQATLDQILQRWQWR